MCVVVSCKQNMRIPDKTAYIRVQPFTGIGKELVSDIADSLKRYYPNIIVAEAVDLPAFAYYAPRKRFKADSLLAYMSPAANVNETILGITKSDISTKNGSIEDWGVMGLGKCPGNACVVSTYRLDSKNMQSQLFKVSIHELGHTFGLPHCKNRECFMRDAEGKNPTNVEKGFCENCKKYLRRYYWKV